MLDSVNFIESLAKMQVVDGAQKLLNAIDDMVVYSSGNVDDAEGISICYPNKTDDIYRSVYMYISEQVDFSEGYRGFISNLYDMDNGNNDGRAMDLSDVTSNVDRIEKADSSSVYDVKLQLSEEQLSNISNINAFIVVDTKKIGWRKNRIHKRIMIHIWLCILVGMFLLMRMVQHIYIMRIRQYMQKMHSRRK